MTYLINKELADRVIHTAVGKLQFDDKGVAKVIKSNSNLDRVSNLLHCDIQVNDELDFSKMSVKQLKEYAKENNIVIPSKVTAKIDIINFLSK